MPQTPEVNLAETNYAKRESNLNPGELRVCSEKENPCELFRFEVKVIKFFSF